MFKINPNNCITVSEQILYNIMEAVTKGIEQPKPVPAQLPVSIGKCAVCGREWTNNGQRLACVRKHKKEATK